MSRRTLVLCGDQWHPATDVQRGLEALVNSPFAFEFITDGGEWSPARLNDFSLVIVAKANHLHAADPRPWLTAQTQGTFREFVRRGGGLFLFHAGTAYKDLLEMRAVTGGAFLSHPKQCPVTYKPVTRNPLAAGVKVFTETEEPYLMALDDTAADVFLHAHSEHGTQPAGWTRTEGAGRVGVLTPGHNAATWCNREFQKLLLNALRWTGRIDLLLERKS